MVSIHQQIASNKRRSFLIIVLFLIFISATAYLIAQGFDIPHLLPLAIIFSIGSSLISYLSGDKLVLSLHHATPATKKDYFNFCTLVENLAIKSQLPIPKTYVINSSALNAFATGRDPHHASICATTGLLNQLDRTELEAVLAHELSHIQNYDTRLMTIVSILIGTLTILINFSSSSFIHRDRKNRSDPFLIIGLILIVFAPIIAKLIQLAISRQREYLADASAINFTKYPAGLIRALTKISQQSTNFTQASTATATLYIHNPFKNNRLANLFSTHPSIESRIQALSQML